MKWHYETRGKGISCHRIVDENGVNIAFTRSKETALHIIELHNRYSITEERREIIKSFVKDFLVD